MTTSRKKKARTRTRTKPAKAVVASVQVAVSHGKKKSGSPPPPRLSRHKRRAAWFRTRVAWPRREGSSKALARERRRARTTLAEASIAAGWQLAGPVNTGGRCTSLVCHPTRPEHVWIGAAGGGVWATRDGGKSWEPSWPANAPLEIGSLAIDPSDPDTLYCGTGEANLSADSYPGSGIYRSTSGGRSWRLWASSDRGQVRVPRRIGAIAVDPFDSRHVMAAGIGYGLTSAEGDMGGLYVTRDGGGSWERATFVSKNNYWCYSVVFDPARRGVVFASMSGPGAANGIYRSTNGGRTWTQLKKGLPPTERVGRATIAPAPSDSRVVYALVADEASESSDRLLGVFRSEDGGDSWLDVTSGSLTDEGQMSYNNTIAVDPGDPRHVICGGVDLHRSTDGGATWIKATKWDARRPSSHYAHSDHHALVMPAAAPGLVYDANDGGLDVSSDGGHRWENRSAGLAITMFYDIDVSASDARLYGGGAQDNGTILTTTGPRGEFREIEGGDGGWMVVDPREAGHIYASWYGGGISRLRNGRKRDVSPPFRDADNGDLWMVYITMDPRVSDTVYTGNSRVYRTTNDGLSWDALTTPLDGSPISAIEVAPKDTRVVYVGTENGGFFRTLDGGVHWSANLASAELPKVTVTRIESDWTNARRVYVTMANSGHSHVFRSDDAGTTWTDLDRGRLPDVPHHALLLRPDGRGELFVASDAGVFVTADDGKSWRNATANLPNAMVVDLVYHRGTKTLLAATYGRSIWQRRLG